MGDADEKYMRRALELAAIGAGNVEPNPKVGCVIVKDGEVIGEGFHEKFGQGHAEVNALANCRQWDSDPKDATMYVTLEPCSHHGKTPPCADAVIEAGVKKVVAAMGDPAEHVSGQGFDKLRAAGIEVEVGLCQRQAELLNPGFIKLANSGMPWVIAKWAQSADGFLAWANRFEDGQWISNQASRADVHKLRQTAQAIVVGVDTAIADDPQLTARPTGRKKSLRIVLDSMLRIPVECKLLDTTEAPTLVVTTHRAFDKNPDKAEDIIATGAEVLALKEVGSRPDIGELLTDLGKQKIQTVIVEGGVKVLDSFIEGGFADAVQIYIAPKELGTSGDVAATEKMMQLAKGNGLSDVVRTEFDGDVRVAGVVTR
jgi:diaminohydroxyphosphoribosylaminopyrimidine deaminase/5-amino-6-(5-phosphoribosylamino)uracil reductase